MSEGGLVQESVEVNAPVGDVFDYWRTLENLPRFMKDIEEVRQVGAARTHWRIKGPLGLKLEFDAETVRDDKDRVLAWSVDGEPSGGRARFEEVGPGRTRVEVTVDGDDGDTLREDLARFAGIVERGELRELREDRRADGPNEAGWEEDHAWLDSDLSGLSNFEPYEWAEGELEAGEPVRYVPGVGAVAGGSAEEAEGDEDGRDG